MAKIRIVGIADGKKENITFKVWDILNEASVVFFETAGVLLFDEMKQKVSAFKQSTSETINDIIKVSERDDVAVAIMGDIVQSGFVQALIKGMMGAMRDHDLALIQMPKMNAIMSALKDGVSVSYDIQEVKASTYEVLPSAPMGVLIGDIDKSNANVIFKKLTRQVRDNVMIYISNEKGEASAMRLSEFGTMAVKDERLWAFMPPVQLKDKIGYSYDDLKVIMKQLRAPDGCPWDGEQTHDSLKKYLVEEAYEVYDAVVSDNMELLYDELGDVLLQVIFHAEIASERGAFDAMDVTTAVCKKMVNRHPHVFGDVIADTSEEVLVNWEQIKKREKGIKNFTHNLKDVPKSMPSLMRSQKVQKRAAACGFDWDDYRAPFEKVYEELEELKADIEVGLDPNEEMGDVLVAVTNLARHLKIEAETVLYNGVEKFIHRFENMEKKAEEQGKNLDDLTLDEMDVFWEAAKRQEKESK